MSKKEKEVTLEDLYWATLSKNDIIRILKDNCSKNIILEKQKADLEAKLAESEEEIKEWIAVRDDKNKIINNQTEKINQLKQQLAEKEEELKKSRNEYWEVFDKLDEKSHRCEIATLENIMFEKKLEQANQDKISFAVEQLKAVKLSLISNWGENDCNLFLGDTERIIDNQIKDLKEGENK